MVINACMQSVQIEFTPAMNRAKSSYISVPRPSVDLWFALAVSDLIRSDSKESNRGLKCSSVG